MSDTPRTDAAIIELSTPRDGPEFYAPLSLCRELERENAQLRALLGASLPDTERLNWLEEKKPDVDYSHRLGGWLVTDENAMYDPKPTVREAIDHARAQPDMIVIQ